MFYAVKKGHVIGVFDNWPDAQSATAGFSGAEYKKFKTREEAEAYLDNRDIWVEKVAEDSGNGYLVAFTDGSFDKELERYSYGVNFILPDGTEESICGYGSNPDYIDSNNIIGEIFGIINATVWVLILSMFLSLPLIENGMEVRENTVIKYVGELTDQTLLFVSEHVDLEAIEKIIGQEINDVDSARDIFEAWLAEQGIVNE